MDDRTRMIPAVKKERRRRWTEKGIDLIIVGLICAVVGFMAGVAWMTVAVR